MKWIKILPQIHAKIQDCGTVGKCPYCDSEDTDYFVSEKENGRGYLDVWCNSCGERVHFDSCYMPEDCKHMRNKRSIRAGNPEVRNIVTS